MNVSNVDSVLAQMRAVMALAQGGTVQAPTAASSTGSVDFANVLKRRCSSTEHCRKYAESFCLGRRQGKPERHHDFYAKSQHRIPDYSAGSQQNGCGL